MRNILVATSVVVAMAVAASADAQTSPSDWTGFYAGVNAGWAHSADDAIANTGTDTGAGGLGTGLAVGAIPSTIRLRNDSVIFGVQGGYNWQRGIWVFGGEADFDGAGMSHHFSTTRTVTGFVPQTTTASRELDWLMTLRGRAGIAPVNPLLLYLTGGLAVGQNRNGIAFVCPTCGPPTSTEPSTARQIHDVSPGWTVGAGAEWAFAARWSVKAEYLYVDLGDTNAGLVYNYGTSTSTLAAKFHNNDHIFRIGFNYHFGVPSAPPTPAAVTPPPPPPPPAAAPARQNFIVFFDFDKSTLTPDGQKVVDAAAAAYKSGGRAKISIAGYTDRAGTPTYNVALSRRRALTVQAALEKDGVPANQISAAWFGEEHPRVPTPDGVREPQNRRVEIEF